MNYKNLIYLITIFFVTNCTTSTLNENKLKTTIDNVFINKGFTLIYILNI